MEENETSTRKLVIIGVIAFALGFGLSWIIFHPRSSDTNADEDAPRSETSASQGDSEKKPEEAAAPAPSANPGIDVNASLSAVSGEKNSLSVESQAAGDRVAIKAVALENGGWVAIHEERNGAPGNILGAARIGKSGTTAAVVELLRNTSAGQTYYAMLHSEDGDGAFDMKKDLPLKNASGEPVMVKFTAR